MKFQYGNILLVITKNSVSYICLNCGVVGSWQQYINDMPSFYESMSYHESCTK